MKPTRRNINVWGSSCWNARLRISENQKENKRSLSWKKSISTSGHDNGFYTARYDSWSWKKGNDQSWEKG